MKLFSKTFLRGNTDTDRIEESKIVFQNRFSIKKVKIKDNDKEWESVKIIEKMLEECTQAIKDDKVDKAWKLLNNAMLEEINIMDNQECLNRAEELKQEAHKLKEWRKITINNLLKDIQSIGKIDEHTKRLIYDAQRIRNEHFDNEYFKIRIRSRNLKAMSLYILGVLLILCIYFIFVGCCDISCSRGVIFIIPLFGMLGGAISVLQKYAANDTVNNVLVEIATRPITLLRPVLGAASAFIVYFFINAGLLNPELLPDPNTQPSRYLFFIFSISFIAGFSERFLVKMVEKIAEK